MGKKHLLLFGIPGRNFIEFLMKYYPAREGWKLLCAEGRPSETILSERMQELSASGYETILISDNMVGFCLSKKGVETVFLFYQRVDEECAYCQGGSLLIAVLAKELGVPCHLYPTEYDPEKAVNTHSLSFAGDTIVPKGVGSFIPEIDKVPMGFVSQKW